MRPDFILPWVDELRILRRMISEAKEGSTVIDMMLCAIANNRQFVGRAPRDSARFMWQARLGSEKGAEVVSRFPTRSMDEADWLVTTIFPTYVVEVGPRFMLKDQTVCYRAIVRGLPWLRDDTLRQRTAAAIGLGETKPLAMCAAVVQRMFALATDEAEFVPSERAIEQRARVHVQGYRT